MVIRGIARLCGVLFCLGVILPGTVGAEGALKHRAFIGLGYRGITAVDSVSAGLPESKGLVINRVLPGSPAERAGLHVGDVILSLDDLAVLDEAGLRTILRQRYAGEVISISVLRGGSRLTVLLTAAALPEETAEGVAIEYGAFLSRETPLRAVVASPPNAAGRKLPAVLIVSALTSPQLIGVPFHSLSRELAYRLARAGFRVLRFELRGAGDSDGEDYRTMGFDAEVEDNLAALDYLASRPDVDPRRIFVFGHSTGGMEAAVMAGRREIAGLVVSCTVGRTYFERMAETLRLQGKLEGKPEPEIDRTVRNYLSFAVAVARGATVTELKQDTTFAGFFNGQDRIMDDRTVEFWRQQLNLDMAGTYARVACPVLIIYAGSDYLTQLACHERIRDLLTGAGNTDVSLKVIPGCDHAYSQAGDYGEAFENRRKNEFRENPRAGAEVLDWLLRH